jgi:hypothetical protein
MSQASVRVQLELAASDHLEAVVTFTNESVFPVYLETTKTQMGERLEHNVFHVYDGDERVPFAGRMAKMPPPGSDDFVPLEPSQTIQTRLRLDPWYRFPPGEREYQVYYQSFNASRGDQPLFRLLSNTARIRYDGRP